jgi:phage shock protein C
MFCSRCGRQLARSSRICPACGTAATTTGQSQPTPPMLRTLTNRVFGGVCAAFALHYGWKLSRVRLVTAFIILFTCIGGIAYLAAWFIIPQESYPSTTQSI